MLQLSINLMRLFGYPYNNDLVICKDSHDYLILAMTPLRFMVYCGRRLHGRSIHTRLVQL